MGNRLSKITTRTGDTGSTGLATGERVGKSHARIEAIGDVDELNSYLGVLLAVELPEAIHARVALCQHELFDLGGELSMPGYALIQEGHLVELEQAAQTLNADLPPLKEFILPSGGLDIATCHVARTIARRAERRVWALNELEPLNPFTPQYLNRLSDYLFIAARVLAKGREVAWVKRG
jgi:cob(I)alamin adenosyltransferase